MRTYFLRLLKPHRIEIDGRTRIVDALQIPIRMRHLVGKRFVQRKIDPAQVEEAFLAQEELGPISIQKGLTLHPKSWEEGGITENFLVVLDEKSVLPTCNLDNSVLDNAGFRALEITKGTPKETVREAIITMMLAGSGHHERLVRLQNQPEFNFIIDKLDLFFPFLNWIKDETIRKFTETALLLAFNQFYIGPSSTSGKYHPADEVALGGLLHHSKRVAQLALELCKKLGLDPALQDEIIAAALLHDICKSVTKNEQGEFEWRYHSVEDHSVIAAEWLQDVVLAEYFPNLPAEEREKIERIAQSVYYHQNIWVDNYDTALTPKNSLNDWLVASSDIIAGLPNARVHCPREPRRSPEEVLNDLLDHPPESQSEYIQKTDNPKLKRSIFLAEILFRQFKITEKRLKDRIIEAIRKGRTYPAENLSRSKSKLIVTLAQIVPQIEEVEIWLPEDVAREAKKVKRTPLKWHSRVDPLKAQKVAEELPELLLQDHADEYLVPLKQELLAKINRGLKKNRLSEDEFSNGLLLGLMLELGTLDIDKIYQRIYEVCDSKGREAIRNLLKESSSVEASIEGIRKIVKDSGYSGTVIGKAESKLRERLNQELPSKHLRFKKIDPSIVVMLKEEFGEELAEEIMAEMVEIKPNRVLRRIETRLGTKPAVKVSRNDELIDFVESHSKKYRYHKTSRNLVITGSMTKKEKDELMGIFSKPSDRVAIKKLFKQSKIYKKIRDTLLHELQYCQPQPFNRMNRDVINWLMQRYRTIDGNLLFEKIYTGMSSKKRKAAVKILQECEAKTRRLEARYRSSVPKAERKKLLDPTTRELSKILPKPKKEKEELPRSTGIIPELKSLAQFLVNYGLKSIKAISEYLKFPRQTKNYEDYDYFNYKNRPQIPGIAKGVEIALEKIDKIDQGEKIMIYGDYDVDGITGTTILVKSLREIAAEILRRKGKHSEEEIEKIVEENIHFFIPNRKQGFGLNNLSLKEIIDAGFRTIITTDNGGNNLKEIEFAKKYNPDVKIIVTDHHTLSKKLPQADAIIHTKLLPKKHAARYLAGAGVAYKFARALYDKANLDIGQKYLEYVAMATITDVVPVPEKSENRAFLYFGFKRFNELFKTLHELEKERKELELNEMGDSAESPSEPQERGKLFYDREEFKKSGLDIGLYLLAKNLRIYSLDRDRIAFGLGPILNAIGRLAEASPAVELFLTKTKDSTKALQILEKLVKNNETRKDLQAKITEEALAQLEKMIKDGTFDPEKDYSVILTSENWPLGIAGLVAKTIADEIRGLAAIGDGQRASWRAIPGFHIMEVLRRAVELYQQDGHRGSFFEKYGGHAGAAGHTLKEDKLEELKIYIKRAAQEKVATDPVFRAMYGEGKPEKFVRIDAYIPATAISTALYQLIKLFGPFGRESYERTNEVAQPIWGNKGLKVVGWRAISGKKKKKDKGHLEITFEDETGRKFSGLYFGENRVETKALFYREDPQKEEVYVDIVYTLDVDYKGNPKLIIKDLKEAPKHKVYSKPLVQ